VPISVRKLPSSFMIEEKLATHVAFDSDEPTVQAYGDSEQSARVAFLTKTKAGPKTPKEPKPAPAPAPPTPPKRPQ
jgi:hypothetical protein